MRDDGDDKSEEQRELDALRRRVAELERDKFERKQSEDSLRESERYYHGLVNCSSDVVWRVNMEGVLTFVSPSVRTLCGFEPKELIGLPFEKLLTEDSARKNREFLEGCKQGGLKGPVIIELIHRRKDGTEFLAEIRSAPVSGANDEVIGVQGITCDITEREKEEEVLRRSEKLFREIFENTAVGVYRTTPDGQILMANPALVHMLGYSSFEELSQRNLEEEGFEPQYRRSTFKEEIEREGRIVGSESTWITRDGKTLHVIENARAVRDEDGKTMYYEGTAENITERKQAREALRESEQKYRGLSESLNELVYRADPETFVATYVNNAVERFYGYSSEEWLRDPNLWEESIHPDDKQRTLGEFTEARRKLKSAVIEYRIVKKGKEVRWVEDHVSWEKDQHGKLVSMNGVMYDITERKKLVQTLRESEERYRTLVESSGESIVMFNKDGVFLFINETGAKRLGGKPKDYVGKTMWDLFPKKIADQQVGNVRKVISTGQGMNTISMTELQGHPRWYNTNIEPLRNGSGEVTAALLIARDIHEQKQAEEQLNEYREKMARAERLASLGTLTATMAHSLNSPLTAIQLAIENSLADLETISCPGTVIEDLRDGLSAVSDAASTVKTFRDFARKIPREIVGEVNLNNVAERIVKLLRESARRARVSLQLKGMNKLPIIYSHEKYIERLFCALIENAIQAADGKKDCRLVISGSMKDEHIELRFIDTCGGIAPENLERIFEPFFTTGPVGERTGLGLCIVEQVLSEIGGKVRVESKAGKGSTFIITLPLGRGMESQLSSNDK